MWWYTAQTIVLICSLFSLFGILFLREEFLMYGHSKPSGYYGFVFMLITSCFSKSHLLFSYLAYQNLQSWFMFSIVLLTMVSFLIASSAAGLAYCRYWPLAPFTIKGRNIPSSLPPGSLERCLLLSSVTLAIAFFSTTIISCSVCYRIMVHDGEKPLCGIAAKSTVKSTEPVKLAKYQ